MRETTALRPLHPSVTPKVRKPNGFHRIALPAEHREVLERVALETFTMASNAGLPFGQALLSLLLTGMDMGINSKQERYEDN